jgi:hypothetical protein
MKKLLGRNEVDEAVSQLDMLTKEESLMVVVRNLEITQRVDGDVKATKVLAEDIGDNVNAAKVLTEDVKVIVKDNAKGIQGVAHRVDNGTKHYLSIFIHIRRLITPLLSYHSHIRA